MDRFSRTQLIIGKASLERLKSSHIAVFGIGGVGGYAVEALARAGVGKIDIIDNDKVSITNINRQIIALESTIGQYKTDVMEKRLKDINPDIIVKNHKCFFLPQTELDFSDYDYVIDAVDTVTAKLEIIMRAKNTGIRVISCMGTGNKLDPSQLKITDIYKTSMCPLAKVMRKECKDRGIKELKVLYSTEQPIKPFSDENTQQPSESGRAVPGSISFVPPCAGLMIAGEVIRDIIQKGL